MSSWGQGGPPGWQPVRNRVLLRDGYRCCIKVAGVCIGTATQVDHRTPLVELGIRRDDPRALDPSNLWSACGPCHDWKTERERIKALAASNRARAEIRRKRRARARKHPGDY